MVISAARQQHAVELDSSVYLDPSDVSLDPSQAELVRARGRGKARVFASITLCILSLVATKFYMDHKSTGVGTLILYCLGMFTIGLFVSWLYSKCHAKPAQFVTTQPSPTPHLPGSDLDMPMMHPRDEVLLVVEAGSPQRPVATTSLEEIEEPPPPPYHIAILLPPKEGCDESPPPSYEKAVR